MLEVILFSTTVHLRLKKQRQKKIALKNVFDEAVKIINLIKSWPLSTYLFNTLDGEMGSIYKHSC